MPSVSSSPDARRAGAVLRGLLTAVFLAAAGIKLTAVPFETAGFTRFGYPLWFMYAVGILQLVGAALLWRRRLVSAGAALLAALMAGAVASHLRAGDPVAMALPALVLLTACAGLAWAWRPEASAREAGHTTADASQGRRPAPAPVPPSRDKRSSSV